MGYAGSRGQFGGCRLERYRWRQRDDLFGLRGEVRIRVLLIRMVSQRSCRQNARTLWVRAFLFGLAVSGQLHAARADLALAVELFETGNWDDCRREARRSCIQNPQEPHARLLDAVACLQLGLRKEESLAVLREVVGCFIQEDQADLAAVAAFELGRGEESSGRWKPAWNGFRTALLVARSPDLAVRAAAGLDRLRSLMPQLAVEDPALLQTLDAISPRIPDEIRAEIQSNREIHPSKASRPSAWVVSLYRTQIRPAIGHRCDLNPSCSEYFLQAGRRHGLLSFPMIADRLFREPSVGMEAKSTTIQNGIRRINDPLNDHDFWLKERRIP